MTMEFILKELSTRRLSVYQLFTLGWSVFRKKIGVILMIAFSYNILWLLLSIGRQTDKSQFLTCGYRFLDSIAGCLSFLGGIAVIFLVEKTLHGQTVSFNTCMRHAFSRFWAMFITQLAVFTPISLLILILFFVIFFTTSKSPGVFLPGVLLAVTPVVAGVIAWLGYTCFTLNIVSLRINSFKALSYNIRLVDHQWWSLFFTNLGLCLLWLPIGLSLVGVYFLVKGSWFLLFLYFSIRVSFTSYWSVVFTLFFLNIDYLKHPDLVAVPATETQVVPEVE
jgi:hypothetical protein